jgi:hypothetical protein
VIFNFWGFLDFGKATEHAEEQKFGTKAQSQIEDAVMTKECATTKWASRPRFFRMILRYSTFFGVFWILEEQQNMQNGKSKMP